MVCVCVRAHHTTFISNLLLIVIILPIFPPSNRYIEKQKKVNSKGVLSVYTNIKENLFIFLQADTKLKFKIALPYAMPLMRYNRLKKFCNTPKQLSSLNSNRNKQDTLKIHIFIFTIILIQGVITPRWCNCCSQGQTSASGKKKEKRNKFQGWVGVQGVCEHVS